MPKSIRFHKIGGPEVLQSDVVKLDEPGPGQARIRHIAIGLNYIDVYHRIGLYPLPLPSEIGLEGAGVVEAVGGGVTNVKPGDRVAYASPPIGAYCEVRNMTADRLVNLPEGISFEQGAAMMMRGMTAQYLIKRTFKVQPGDTVLWHAAAGGVGLIACQWLAALGVTVIGTVGSDAKAKLAKAHGCRHTVNYSRENFVERVKDITRGAGVPVVFDSVGKDTYEGSLECLRSFGMLVNFGNASGPMPPVDIAKICKGTLYLTRPSLMPYTAKREDLVATAKDLFEIVLSGKVRIEINQKYVLKDAAQAQRDLEARKTTGSTILLP